MEMKAKNKLVHREGRGKHHSMCTLVYNKNQSLILHSDYFLFLNIQKRRGIPAKHRAE